jgi:hypothetical protein
MYYSRLIQYADTTETPEFYFKLFSDILRNATKSHSPCSLFWDTMLCSLLGGCQRSRGIRCPLFGLPVPVYTVP